MIIQHNLPGANSRRNLDKNKGKISKSLEELSSGFRINRAADDAAGLAISEGLRLTIQGTEQAERNVMDGIGLIQTAEGAMEEISAMLRRGYELSAQSANSTYNETSRSAMQEELDELREEIGRITENTEFNGIPLLKSDVGQVSGSAVIGPQTGLPAWVTSPSLASGKQSEEYETKEGYTIKNTADNTVASSGQKIVKHAAASIDFSALTSANKSDLLEKGGRGFYNTCFTCDNHYSIKFVTGTKTTEKRDGNHYIYEIGIDNVNTGEDLVKAIVDGVKGNPNNHYTKFIADATNKNKLWIYDDRASENKSSYMPSYDEKTQKVSWDSWTNSTYPKVINTTTCADDGKFGSGVAYAPGSIIPIKGDLTLQIGPTDEETLEIILPGTHEKLLGIDGVSVLTQKAANASMEKFEKAIHYLNGERGRMGSYQNRLEHTHRSLAVSHENLSAAESRIRDTDMAKEITELTKDEIISQGAQFMLSQANVIPQQVLRLLA